MVKPAFLTFLPLSIAFPAPSRTSRRRPAFAAATATASRPDLGPDLGVPLPGGEPEIVDLSPDQRRKKLRARTGGLLDAIDADRDLADTLAPALPALADDEYGAAARTAVRAADGRKAEDAVVVRVANVSAVTRFMVCVTGRNGPQIGAIANKVEEQVFAEHGMKCGRRKRGGASGWVLLDFGEMMVHVFSPEERRNYDMEGLWRRGERMDVSDCVTGPEEKVQVQVDVDAVDDDWL